MPNLQKHFGAIDIYLFDQLLRGRIVKDMRILDAGCGGGRNLVYLLHEGFDVYAVDRDPQHIAGLNHFQVANIEAMPFYDGFFDVVICSAVLHFARDEAHFAAMLRSMWRVLKKEGMFFCRLASSIGVEKQIQLIEGRRYSLPDGSERFLVDEALLERYASELHAALLDPIKTTVVQNQRSMTTWVLRKLR